MRDPFLATNVITPSGFNLVQDGSCQVVGALTGNPGLGALVGSPVGFPLVSGCPAIDRADNARCPGVDQRGSPRPRGGKKDGFVICDLGANEFRPKGACALLGIEAFAVLPFARRVARRRGHA